MVLDRTYRKLEITIWLVVLVVAACYLFFPLGHNQSIAHSFGLVAKNGGHAYIDYVERRGPMGLYPYSLANILFGNSAVALRAFDLIILSLIGWGIFRLCLNSMRLSQPVALIGVALWFINYIAIGPGNTGDVSNIAVLCFVFFLTELNGGHNLRKHAFLGCLMTIAFWVKPTTVVLFLPLVIAMPFLPGIKSKTGWIKVLSFSLIWNLPILAFLYFQNLLYPYIEVIYTDTTQFYSNDTLGSRLNLNTIKDIARWILSNPVFILIGTLGLLQATRKKSSGGLILLIAAISCLIKLFIEHKYYPYHFTPLYPLLAVGIVYIAHTMFQGKYRNILLGLVAAFLLIIPAKNVIYPFTTKEPKLALFQFDGLRKQYLNRIGVSETLRPFISKNDELYVIGSYPGIYLETGLISNCRFFYHGQELLQPYDSELPPHRKKWKNEVLTYLENTPPDLLVFDTSIQLDTKTKTRVFSILNSNFESVATYNDFNIYQSMD